MTIHLPRFLLKLKKWAPNGGRSARLEFTKDHVAITDARRLILVRYGGPLKEMQAGAVGITSVDPAQLLPYLETAAAIPSAKDSAGHMAPATLEDGRLKSHSDHREESAEFKTAMDLEKIADGFLEARAGLPVVRIQAEYLRDLAQAAKDLGVQNLDIALHPDSQAMTAVGVPSPATGKKAEQAALTAVVAGISAVVMGMEKE